MQKLMSFVLSATMFAYMACAETPQKNSENTLPKKSSTETIENQMEKIAFIPKTKNIKK